MQSEWTRCTLIREAAAFADVLENDARGRVPRQFCGKTEQEVRRRQSELHEPA